MKKISPVIVVGVLLTVLCIALYLAGPPILLDLAARSYDVLMRRSCEAPKSGKVALVDIDEASLAELGQWPWPRYLLARLTDRLFEAGASVVAFDVVFPEPDRTSPSELAADMKRHLGIDLTWQGIPDEYVDSDAVFARSLHGKQVVLACVMHPCETPARDPDISNDLRDQSPIFTKRNGKGQGDAHPFLMQADGIIISIPKLADVAGKGAIMMDVGEDVIVRAVPMVWALGDKRLYPSLSLEALRLHLGSDKCGVTYDEHGIVGLRIKDVELPVDRGGRLVVNYRRLRSGGDAGFEASFPLHSARDVLAGGIDRTAIEGRIVFVGTSAAGLKDLRATPLTPTFSGVEVHATAADNILAGDALRRPNWILGAHVVAILLTGLVITLIAQRASAWIAFGGAMGAAGAAVALSYVLLVQARFVFTPAWIVTTVAVTYPVLTMLRFWQAERHRRRVRRMFATMVSRDVLKYLEDNPESFSLTGRKTEATMCFTDVAGFTAISEELAPERLTELLNSYLSPMTRIIMERDGYVDKYEGDLIMAEWGVPFPMRDHAVQACLAALEKRRTLEDLRPVLKEEFGHDIHMRVGINTGMVTAGNMGSEQRFEYTVMGDAVNLASRLEPANKDYGTEIIIGSATYEAAKEHVEVRLLDRILVRGKNEPDSIYELLSRKGQLPQAKAQVVALYEEALELHWKRRWDEAVDRLRRALEIDPGDGPCRELERRVAEYIAEPPAADWKGVYVRAEKD